MLDVERLRAGYGATDVLWDISLSLVPGRTTCVVGANGAGKTTLLRAIMGLLKPSSGKILMDGLDVSTEPPHRRARLGLALVPEGRQLFTSLTVQENLDMGATSPRSRPFYRRQSDQVFDLFPLLQERRRQMAGTLSGGEQQMLAIGRALMSAPAVLMLDEPSMGLAPLSVLALYRAIQRLGSSGMTILLVEQSVPLALAISHHAYVIAGGRVALSGPAQQLRDAPEIKEAYLGRFLF